MISLVRLLPWALPPLLGALIGYVTNAIAIKMLFRPLQEWRIFGVRVPLTPGIIPRQRYRLAENIGDMVSKELLTEDTLARQINTEKFSNGLSAALSRFTAGILDKSLFDLGTVVADPVAPKVPSVVEELIRGFLRSKGIKKLIRLVMHAGLHRLTSYRVKDLLRTEDQKTKLVDWLFGIISSSEAGTSIAHRSAKWIERQKRDGTKVGDFIPNEAPAWAESAIDIAYDPVCDFALRWLQSEGMKKQLEIRGRYLLRDILDKLSGFQRFLVAATQYDRTLDDKMAEIIDDVLQAMKETLADSETRKRLLRTVKEAVNGLREKKIKEIDENLDLGRKIQNFLDTSRKAMSQNSAERSLKSVFMFLINQVEGRTLESFLERAFTVSDAAEYLSELVVGSVERSADRISRAAVMHLAEIVDSEGRTPIGALLGITRDAKHRLDSRIAQIARKSLVNQVPAILGSLDLREMVVTKINGLNVEDVEGLIVRVIHRHLKWINVFGAILGFLIGMVQIVSRLVLS